MLDSPLDAHMCKLVDDEYTAPNLLFVRDVPDIRTIWGVHATPCPPTTYGRGVRRFTPPPFPFGFGEACVSDTQASAISGPIFKQ